MNIPKGKLIIIGGHEEKGIDGERLKIATRNCSHPHPHLKILSELTSMVPRAHHIIEIITSASTIPEQVEEMYRKSYQSVGYNHVKFMRIENKMQANDIDFIRRIATCHAVFFTGGDQTRLTTLLNNSLVLKEVNRKYLADPHFIVAGTSAGAMAIPETIINGGVIREALMKNDIKMGKGFNLISDIIVDTHFIKRGRFARLAHAVALNPTLLGIGLGEDTAFTISKGNEATCSGSGMVIIIDGSEISKTNISESDFETPVIIENLKVHIIAEENTFLIRERKFKI